VSAEGQVAVFGLAWLVGLAGQGAPATAPSLPAVPAPARELKLVHPFPGAVFPRDIAPPLFRWQESGHTCDAWQIHVEFAGEAAPVQAAVTHPEWRPDGPTWERIKRHSLDQPARAVVTGLRVAASGLPECRGDVTFSTSPDPVEAPLFYREVNLPFVEAVKDPSRIQWRFGPVSATNPPPVVLGNLPVCGNCHSFSRDGTVLGMDADYANSKGSYVITRTAPEMRLLPQDIITWDDFRRDDGELTFGLLSQVSPDGRRVVSTVKDKSIFVPRPELAFSQLFFPIKGILAVYDRETRAFASVPGADDPAFVQSNPVWSPEGQWLVFTRAAAYDLSATLGQGRVLLTPEECREFLSEGKPFQFDLYRLPFNDGRGGRAEPLAGAAGDGQSHYFPRYSPDGRWIVFCKSQNYMLLQPDSELYLIPATGGPARRLRGNLARMNSWHSWSPNGRWLVFSSKGLSDYTQLFLTHLDPEGNSAPPVWLDQFTATNRAANIPEFVNLPPDGIRTIQGRFLNDYSLERAGNEFYRAGDVDPAIAKYREALALNPGNVTAHQRLGFLLFHVKRQFAEGLAHTTEALRLDPGNRCAHSDLGMARLSQHQPGEAVPHLLQALASLPAAPEPRYQPPTIRYHLAQAYMQQGQYAEAATHLAESVRLDPANPEAHYLLALALVLQGDVQDAVRHHAEAVALRPAIDSSVTFHEMLAENYARAGRHGEAIRSAERALTLARAAGKTSQAERIAARLPRYRAGAAPTR
jgi:tetratricopeptide (TPR) repeat protein